MGDGALLRIAYRDTSLRSYYFTDFSSARAGRGPVLFFAVSLGHLDVMGAQLMTPISLASSAVGFLFVPLYMVWFVRKFGPGQIRHVEWATLDIGR
jgi:hypothetical protein